MDYNIVTLEIAGHLVHFNYYDQLVSDTGVGDEQAKLRRKSEEHLSQYFAGINFYNTEKELFPLKELKALIIPKLAQLKNKEIHELVEVLEKDTKKMKKLYKSTVKK